ncbi:MAG: hypothetical protein ACKV19_01325 [Verrucomicrobiales bacterium]
MNEEFRQRLRAARPSGQDERDPDVSEAREAAADDPAEVAALEQERVADVHFARALQSAPIPPDLEARVRAAVRAVQKAETSPSEPDQSALPARFPAAQSVGPTRRRWLAWAGAAAAVTAAGLAWWRRWPARLTLDRLATELAAISTRGVTLSLMTMDRAAIATWMRDQSAPRADTLPSKLDALGRKGCHLYTVAGHPVSLECFMWPDGEVLHLFSTESDRLVDPPLAGAPAREVIAPDHAALTWAEGRWTLMLLGHRPIEEIQALLG